jgi:hypothetical protein
MTGQEDIEATCAVISGTPISIVVVMKRADE